MAETQTKVGELGGVIAGERERQSQTEVGGLGRSSLALSHSRSLALSLSRSLALSLFRSRSRARALSLSLSQCTLCGMCVLPQVSLKCVPMARAARALSLSIFMTGRRRGRGKQVHQPKSHSNKPPPALC